MAGEIDMGTPGLWRPRDFKGLSVNGNAVPCEGCRACCQREALILHPEMGDKPWEYLCRTFDHPLTGQKVFALDQKENGECIYLGEKGCTNYENRPSICREFDCRRFYLGVQQDRPLLKFAQAMAGDEILLAGRARLHTLNVPSTDP